MSKGFGKWQRAVMAALDKYAAFYPIDLLPANHSRSEVVALNRAVRSLANAGKLVVRYWKCRVGKGGFVTVRRPDYAVEHPNQVVRINVAEVEARDQCNT